MKLWQNLILSWHQKHRDPILSLAESPLFENKTINRTLSAEGRVQVVDYIVSTGHAEWEDKRAKKRCRLFWKHPTTWAGEFYQFVRRVQHSIEKGYQPQQLMRVFVGFRKRHGEYSLHRFRIAYRRRNHWDWYESISIRYCIIVLIPYYCRVPWLGRMDHPSRIGNLREYRKSCDLSRRHCG